MLWNQAMSKTHPTPTYKGRNMGIVALVAIQVLVGFIHVVFGFWLLLTPRAEPFALFDNGYFSSDIYSIYTIVFGLLTLVFTVGLWLEKRWGWGGTVTVLVFVIVADSLTLLNLPSVPGIPKFAGFGEITYSVLVTLYLFQKHLRTKYRV
jgi:hypothetical protein